MRQLLLSTLLALSACATVPAENVCAGYSTWNDCRIGMEVQRYKRIIQQNQ